MVAEAIDRGLLCFLRFTALQRETNARTNDLSLVLNHRRHGVIVDNDLRGVNIVTLFRVTCRPASKSFPTVCGASPPRRQGVNQT